ncbi:MAG TPA: beta-ketoacyl-[acyl-carrier-protein] synthase family protein [Vicinamibacterales bacterium]|nr:beta-ketoacyl-[acyl-carrier-protein] synthase family protein [Vicinamibacterales bacterium]
MISGIGAVTCFGVGRECYWDHIRRGISGTRSITEFDVSTYPCRVAAPVPPVSMADAQALHGENGNGRESRADPRRYSRAALFGVLAAREAWNDAGLSVGERGAGVLIGSGGGGIDVGEAQYRDFFTAGGRHVTPYAIALGIVGMVSSEISISLGLRGISHVISTGCTSSTDAIGYAASLIRAGEAEVLLSGGVDGCVTPGMIFGFSRMRAVSTRYNDRASEASRPFDRGRDGFVLGEGAWMVVLERDDRARARGAPIYASIEGYASTCDAYHRVQMDPDGEEIVACLTGALRKAGRAPSEIGYINYHGTSTQLNDAIEATCVRRVFGRAGDDVPGSSTKSMIGHPQGASGAAGVVAAALALSRGFLPPTANLVEPDERCDMDYLPREGRAAQPAFALCNCLGFGSKNSALVLAHPEA